VAPNPATAVPGSGFPGGGSGPPTPLTSGPDGGSHDDVTSAKGSSPVAPPMVIGGH
jgi:hypothetical protein